jgi:hypothetical protein
MLLVFGRTETIVFNNFFAKGMVSNTNVKKLITCKVTNKLESNKNTTHYSFVKLG